MDTKKNFSLDEMGQVNSDINNITDVISPNNTIGSLPGHPTIGIPFKNGEGLNIKDYQTRVSGGYTPGKKFPSK
jgi:hypothetical protein